jgi:hypothetical protein
MSTAAGFSARISRNSFWYFEKFPCKSDTKNQRLMGLIIAGKPALNRMTYALTHFYAFFIS